MRTNALSKDSPCDQEKMKSQNRTETTDSKVNMIHEKSAGNDWRFIRNNLDAVLPKHAGFLEQIYKKSVKLESTIKNINSFLFITKTLYISNFSNPLEVSLEQNNL